MKVLRFGEFYCRICQTFQENVEQVTRPPWSLVSLSLKWVWRRWGVEEQTHYCSRILSSYPSRVRLRLPALDLRFAVEAKKRGAGALERAIGFSGWVRPSSLVTSAPVSSSTSFSRAAAAGSSAESWRGHVSHPTQKKVWRTSPPWFTNLHFWRLPGYSPTDAWFGVSDKAAEQSGKDKGPGITLPGFQSCHWQSQSKPLRLVVSLSLNWGSC